MSTNPYLSPNEPGDGPKKSANASTISLIKWFFVVVGLALLAALFLPSPRFAPEAARRAQCGNNLRQISLALRNYEETYHALPPAYTVDAKGKPLHSWRTLILPFLGQEELYKKIDLSKPWNDPANKAASETVLPIFRCPSTQLDMNLTLYQAVVVPNGCWPGEKSRTLAEITDDRELTLLIVEASVANAVHWMSPQDTSEQWLLDTPESSQAAHHGRFQAVTVSGRTLSLRRTTSPEGLTALFSISGNDNELARQELD